MDRAATLISATLASVLAGVALAAVPHTASAAPDACLSGPQGAAPKGQRWYYHLDRATQQKCWYLRAPGDSTAQSAASQPVALQPPAPAAARAPARQPDGIKVQDAHAEWPAPPAASAPDATGSVPQTALWSPANPVGAPQDTHAQQATVTPPANDASAAPTSATSPPTPAPQASQPAQGDATPAARAATKSSEPIHTLLLVIAGALALAGVVASIVFRLSARQRAARQDTRARRSVNWEPVVTSEPPRRVTPSRIAAPAPIAAEPRHNRDTRDQDLLDQDLDNQDLDNDADIGQITDLLEQFIKQGPKLELSVDLDLERATPSADTVHPELQRLARSSARA
ncbi:hypothetical protein [Bradyrhizobium prioriisuperbiae]|uniref:hypothetical protein n=1 Tax=Bradyrhizobium prioriisuperbiae TaxID=2854389 RepID=UPI0028E99216|nr:hypothetical protein [Bradyrhizobium prioritasuperba]